MFTVAVICVISSQRALSEAISIGIDIDCFDQGRCRVRSGPGLRKKACFHGRPWEWAFLLAVEEFAWHSFARQIGVSMPALPMGLRFLFRATKQSVSLPSACRVHGYLALFPIVGQQA